MTQKMRTEKDSVGELLVPAEAYYGIQSVRASQNFPISGLRAEAELVEAVMFIKKAAALVNSELHQLDKAKAEAIIKACDEVIAGKFRDQFIVDVFQMGAGTSFHMNCNEVLANRASELMGGKKGEYLPINPHDHVNLGQSTNDVFPTAMRLSILFLLQGGFLKNLQRLEEAFQAKADEFRKIIKSGRTHLQDAAPVTLGQEFKAYSISLTKGRHLIERAGFSLNELGIGGSAVGTGLNTAPGYTSAVISHLRSLTGLELNEAEDKQEAVRQNKTLLEILTEKNLFTREEITGLLNPIRMTEPKPSKKKK